MLGADEGGAGVPVAEPAVPVAEPAAGEPAGLEGVDGTKPLSKLGAGAVAPCGLAWLPPDDDGAAAPPLVCAMIARGCPTIARAMVPAIAHSAHTAMMKRKTPHPQLEPASPNDARLRSRGP